MTANVAGIHDYLCCIHFFINFGDIRQSQRKLVQSVCGRPVGCTLPSVIILLLPELKCFYFFT